MSGTGTPMRGRFSYFPRIRRIVCASQLNYSSLRERYVAGREPVTIHPQDATTRESMAIRYAFEPSRAGSGGRGRYRRNWPRRLYSHEGAWPDPEPTAGGMGAKRRGKRP